VISELITGLHNVLRFLIAVRTFFLRMVLNRRFPRIIIEFLTEVGVLLMVFPMLDTVIEKGESKVTGGLVAGSLLITVFCLLAAGVISMYEREE